MISANSTGRDKATAVRFIAFDQVLLLYNTAAPLTRCGGRGTNVAGAL